MRAKIVINYHIAINNNAYIIVNGIEFANSCSKIYPNIRSIEIHINDQVYTYYNDNELRTIIEYYLYSQENVKLINLISNRIINKNWFECYSDESSGNVLGSQDVQIKPELLDKKSNIKITELYKTKTLLENEVKYVNKFHTYPIWHINGKHENEFPTHPILNINSQYKGKNRYCKLYCHYDIMLHILSLRFVEIKSQILNLSITKFHLN